MTTSVDFGWYPEPLDGGVGPVTLATLPGLDATVSGVRNRIRPTFSASVFEYYLQISTHPARVGHGLFSIDTRLYKGLVLVFCFPARAANVRFSPFLAL